MQSTKPVARSGNGAIPPPKKPNETSPVPLIRGVAGRATDSKFICNITPPHSIEIEKCVIGSMLMEFIAAEYAAEILTEDAFYHPRNKVLFSKCVFLFKTNRALDEKLLVASIKVPNLNELRDYVANLMTDTPSPANIDGYCVTLLKLQQERARLNYALKVLSQIEREYP